MDLAYVSQILEPGDEQISDLPISLSHSGQFCNAHFRLSLEEMSVDLPSISCQLRMEFLGNVIYQVNATPVKELGNNLSLKLYKFS